MDLLSKHWRAVEAAADSLTRGETLRQAAAAGVHVATLCRWRQKCPALDLQLRLAQEAGWRARYKPPPRRRPRVRVHPLCPLCGAGVQVRNAFGWPGYAFWRCSGWPSGRCRWASWRPRHPEDCPSCGRHRLWTFSRKSVSCTGCGTRVRISWH
jgi:hypothetical protein